MERSCSFTRFASEDNAKAGLLKFTFLGTGTSAGVPSIGCECRVCTSSDLRDQRLRTSAMIEWTDSKGSPRTLLIDAGPDLRQQALRSGMKRLDGILFTHNHVDHTFGLDEVRRFNAIQKTAIDVFAEKHTMDFLKRVYGHIFDQANNLNQSFVATLIPHLVDPDTAFEFFGLKITPLRFQHGRLPVLGYRIESDLPGTANVLPLAYCTDVSAIPTHTWARLTGLKTLVLDALRHRHHPTHMTLNQALDASTNIAAQSTFFVHMSHDLLHEETQGMLPPHVSLAFDGLVLPLD